MSVARTDLAMAAKKLGLSADITWHAGIGGLESLKAYHVHGYASGLPNGVTSILWEAGSAYLPWRNTAVDDTVELAIASTSADDDAVTGQGAHMIHVWGYDCAGFYKERMYPLDGQVEVSIGTDWLFIQHLMVMTCGSLEENQGSIWCGIAGSFVAGAPSAGNEAQLIYTKEGMSHTSMAFIPSGYDGFLMFSAGCTAKSATSSVTFRMRKQNIVLATATLKPRLSLDKYVVVQNLSDRTHPAGFRLIEHDFVWTDARASTTNMDACTMMDVLLVRKNPDGSSMFTEEDWLTLAEYTRQAG